jgi:SAM-dependent methyltransferase
MNASYYILEKVNKYFLRIALESHNNLLGESSYQCYQTSLEFIEKVLTHIKRREANFNSMKFLDIGSGTGFVCGIAASMGLTAEGIEINPALYEISKQLFPEVRFYNIDIKDFNNYEDYDILFYWLPFRDPELIQEFKKKVENSIHIGAYIIVAEEEIQNYGKDERFIKLDYPSNINGIHDKIWQKIK